MQKQTTVFNVFFFLWKPKSHQDVNVQQNRQVLFSNVIKWLSEKVPHGCFTWMSYLLQKDNHFCQSFIESGSSFVGPICLLVNKIGRHLYHCQLPHFWEKLFLAIYNQDENFSLTSIKTLLNCFSSIFSLIDICDWHAVICFYQLKQAMSSNMLLVPEMPINLSVLSKKAFCQQFSTGISYSSHFF